MQKCKIAVFTLPDTPFALQEVDIPPLGPGEILVKNEYVTLCRSDLNTYSGKRREKTPTILGHEIVGRIVSRHEAHPGTDERGQHLHLNDRISWAIYASDPADALSQAGIPQKAADLFKYGHERITATSNLHGGLAEYTLLRRNTPIVKIDETLPLPQAAIINCAVATVSGAIRLAGDLIGKNVLVSGAGMLGMIACAMSKTAGAARVVAMDINPVRLERACDFGADLGVVGDELEDDTLVSTMGNEQPFHIVIELSGVAEAMEKSLQLLAVGGMAVWVGATYPQRDLRINAEQIVRHLWTIRGLHNYNQHDLVAAVQFMEKHHLDFPFATLIYDGFSLDQVNEAFVYGLEESPFRVGIRIQ
ncbi:MAG: zinc-binding dehydrogenase [Lewinella sp.]|nr:zinc-binding dehydrogenase [Lewinella sp.]